MAQQLFTIKNRSTFLMIKEKGNLVKGKNLNIQILLNQDLNNTIGIGYTATKRIGKAFKRNKA